MSKLKEMADKYVNLPDGDERTLTIRAYEAGFRAALELATKATLGAIPEGYELGKPMFRGEFTYVVEKAIRALGEDE